MSLTDTDIDFIEQWVADPHRQPTPLTAWSLLKRLWIAYQRQAAEMASLTELNLELDKTVDLLTTHRPLSAWSTSDQLR